MFQFHGHHLPGRLCGREGTEQISTGQTDCALPECAEGRVARVVVSGGCGGGTSWDRQDRQGGEHLHHPGQYSEHGGLVRARRTTNQNKIYFGKKRFKDI